MPIYLKKVKEDRKISFLLTIYLATIAIETLIHAGIMKRAFGMLNKNKQITG
ncbi:MAG: hypothetical protein VZR24_05255 [Butyrivibrio hungatei]|nr:hypothetical protein [Butyrivibrio hungatei]